MLLLDGTSIPPLEVHLETMDLKVKYVLIPYILQNNQDWSLYFKKGKNKSHKFFIYQE
jgi:hypothetical protein